jgi:hypothetical protein
VQWDQRNCFHFSTTTACDLSKSDRKMFLLSPHALTLVGAQHVHRSRYARIASKQTNLCLGV